MDSHFRTTTGTSLEEVGGREAGKEATVEFQGEEDGSWMEQGKEDGHRVEGPLLSSRCLSGWGDMREESPRTTPTQGTWGGKSSGKVS